MVSADVLSRAQCRANKTQSVTPHLAEDSAFMPRPWKKLGMEPSDGKARRSKHA